MRGTAEFVGHRLFLAAAAMAVGCSGDGCSCMGDIPGGFPAAERQPNVVQARVTPDGLSAISANGSSIIDAMFADGLTFDVPPSCGGDRKVCCYVPEGYCQVAFDMTEYSGDPPRLELEPISDTRSRLTLRARVETVNPMPVHQAGLFGDIECYVHLDTTWSGYPHITIQADLELVQDPTTGLTGIDVVSAEVYNLADGDVDITGGFLCGFGDPADAAAQMRQQFAEEIPKAVTQLACQECEGDADCSWGSCNADGICELDDAGGRRCVQRIGLEGRLPAVELLGSLMPNEGRDLDIYVALGGFAGSPDGGLSLGVLGGALPVASGQQCVPTLPPPEMPAIPESTVLRGNTHPRTGASFDLGLGVHRAYLDRVAWAAHQSGFLCIDIGAARVPLLTSGSFAILAPSMIDLMHGADAPLLLSIRPQQPPTLGPGAGSFTEDGQIDEPLLSIAMKDMEIDFYALIDQRYVRLLTLTADLDAALGLTVNELGNVTPVLGDLADALSNLRVTHSALLDESPQDLVDKFPAVLSVALPMLADRLGEGEGLALPAFAGLSIELDDSGFTSIEDDSMLGIFGNFVPAGAAARVAPVRTEARVAQLELPPAEAFSAPRWDRDRRPVVTLALGGVAADGSRGGLEWQFRLDGGFWSPFTRDPAPQIRREALWLQGRHTIEVRARQIGAPRTIDPDPVALDVTIDTFAPTLALERTADGYLVRARDGVSDAGELSLRYRLDGGAWLPLGEPPVAIALAGTRARQVEVVAADAAGNEASAVAEVAGFHGRADSASGCDCRVARRRGGTAAVWWMLGLIAGGLALRGRRRLLAGAALVALVALAGCSDSNGGGDDDDDDTGPTAVEPGPTGRWSDLAADGDRVVVSAYEEALGDLVFGTVDADGALALAPIHGVPDAPPALDPTGYRGGVTEPGEDVGAWTSIALHAGEARIAYQDRDAGALRFTEEAGGAWPSHVVDPGADAPTGLYASLALDANGAPGIAYVTHPIPTEEGGFAARLSWARAATASPAATDDWTVTAIDEIRIPCTGLCGDGEVCLVETDACAAVDAADACGDPGCDDGFECVAGACAEIRVAPEAEMLPEGTGLFASAAWLPDGRAAVAYYDHTHGDLYLAIEDEAAPTGWTRTALSASPLRDAGQWCSLAVDADGETLHVAYQDAMDDSLHVATWRPDGVSHALVDDGWRDGSRAHPVGADAELVVDGDGALVVFYQDSATADLVMARRGADDVWTRSDVLTGAAGYGFYVGAAAASARIWVSSYVYDRSVWPPGELTVTSVQ